MFLKIKSKWKSLVVWYGKNVQKNWKSQNKMQSLEMWKSIRYSRWTYLTFKYVCLKRKSMGQGIDLLRKSTESVAQRDNRWIKKVENKNNLSLRRFLAEEIIEIETKCQRNNDHPVFRSKYGQIHLYWYWTYYKLGFQNSV